MLNFHFWLGILIGGFLSYSYGWMKYHYPESREMIAVKVAAQRCKRTEHELATEKLREQIDVILRRRGTG